MRKRFLVLSSVAALSLAALAGSASADTTITTSVKCSGVYAYSTTRTIEVEELPANFKPTSFTYTFNTFRGQETCTVSIG